MHIEYFDVKEKLPPIGQNVWIFFENCAYGGYGLWHQAFRLNNTYFVVYTTDNCKKFGIQNIKYKIDLTDRISIGIGVTHWADLNINRNSLPDLCRRTKWDNNLTSEKK